MCGAKETISHCVVFYTHIFYSPQIQPHLDSLAHISRAQYQNNRISKARDRVYVWLTSGVQRVANLGQLDDKHDWRASMMLL